MIIVLDSQPTFELGFFAIRLSVAIVVCTRFSGFQEGASLGAWLPGNHRSTRINRRKRKHLPAASGMQG
jgi:hypothetical protein